MSSYKPKEIETALKNKGFSKKNNSHKYFSFYYEGKKIGDIYPFISHSKGKEYNDSLLDALKKEMKMDSKENLCKFIECSLTQEDYIRILKSQNVI
ncbi:MAG: hypothetical protein HPY53_04885 [Brevinematales bacterium]|nr:hypothetical protein [Brevinematales bacterium]